MLHYTDRDLRDAKAELAEEILCAPEWFEPRVEFDRYSVRIGRCRKRIHLLGLFLAGGLQPHQEVKLADLMQGAL